MPRVAFHTLGCKLNFAETGTIADQFKKRDYEIVPFGSETDVVVLNTCTVTEQADRKCRQAIRRAMKASPKACVIVTGCFAQISPEQISQMEGVDVVLGAAEKFNLFQYVEAFSKRERTQVEVSCIDGITEFSAAFSASERTRAFLKVQDGCDYTCSFCTIPQARGRSRSDSIAGVVDRASEIAEKGYREIVISGVNIGLFGLEQNESLLSLLRELDRVEGIDRYRISSCEPNLLSDGIIDFVAESRAFMPHFHLPLQSGDDFVLGKMRRRYRRSDYTNRVARIIKQIPDAAIGVDVIVGFPAESSLRFENTFSFIADLPISYLHVFTYSERSNTIAVDQIESMGGTPVDKQIRSQRNGRLRLLSEKKRSTFYSEFSGTERPVLWEESHDKVTMSGFTDNHIRVETQFEAGRVSKIELIRLGNLAPSGNLREAEIASLPIL